MSFNKPQELLSVLSHAYYEERNVEAVLSCVTDDVEWVGTEKNDRARGKAELKRLLESDFAAFPDGFCVELDEPTVHPIGPNAIILTVTGTPHKAPGVTVSSSIRGTICCVNTEQGWLASYGHTSVPNAEIEKISLQNALKEARAKQKALLDNVPGGIAIYRIKSDGRIATDYVSDGLAKICGYDNGQDALRVIGYDARTQLMPADYSVVEEACRASIEQGVPTSIQYRVHTKAGDYVRLSLDSVMVQDVPLEQDDVAVFYAVQALVSEERSKKEEEQEEQISLLNTVPAGIGVFEVNQDGISQNYLNDAFYNLIGAKREDRTQYIGANTLATTHPKDLIKVKQAMKQLLDGENAAQLDYRVMGGTGNWVWLHLVASVVERRPGSVKLHVAYYECTASKHRQLQLFQNQKAIALAEKQGRLGIWTYNIDKGIMMQQAQGTYRGYMGYPTCIFDVPQCLVDAGNVHPEDTERCLSSYHKLAAGYETVDELYRLKDQNTGKFNWLRVYYQRTECNDDGDRIAVGFSIEVNKQQEAVERYQVEQKLREQMYASAIIYMEYNLTDSVYVGHNNLADRYCHGRWEQPTKEQYRENMSAIVDEPYLDEVTDKMYAGNLLKAFESGATKVSCEYRGKERPDQRSIWCRITAVMVKRPDTEDVMAFVYVEDIEKDKVRQIAIESSLSNGIESVAVIHLADRQAWLLQTHNNYVPKEFGTYFIYDDDFVNKAHRVILECTSEFGERAALLSTVTAQLEKQEIYQYSVTTKRNKEAEKRQLIRYRYLDDRKTNIVMSVSDITLIYLEEQSKKKQLENALNEAQKASHAKAEFYSRMSHDMRTPMNGILGMAELSKDETDSARLKENIGKIMESGEYLLSLINDTLDIQRIESGKMKLEPKIVNTTDIVRNILEMISVTAKEKGVQLKFNCGNTDLNWYIRADALRLKQIFINLLSNAVKFTLPGGTVELEFELLAREGMISHDVVYVRDTGVGMSREFLKTGIFKPFSQESNAVSANYAGSGLGLSIAKSLVELMGGHIEVESELGVGTTFAVYLDFERVNEAEARTALQSEKRQSSNTSAQLKGKKILLAEDHPLNAEIARKLLEKVGCIVTWAQNGQEVVSCFADAPACSFDAILMDIRMPLMDGLEATKQIRNSDKTDAKTIPIIAMTANAYEEDVKASMDAGMDAHLGKPINPKILYDTLAMHLHKKV